MSIKPRLGFVVKSEHPAEWKNTIIQKAFNDPSLEIVTFILIPQIEKSKKIWRKHIQLDNKYFKPKPSAFKKAAINNSFSNTPKIDSQDQQAAQSASLDLLINLSDAPLPDYLFDCTRLGVLSFAHGESNQCSEDFLGYWAFIKFGEVFTSALVFQSQADQAVRILDRTWSMMPTLSISRARNEHMWKLTSLMSRALKNIGQINMADFLPAIQHKPIIPTDTIIPQEPTALASIFYLAKHFYRMAYKAFRKLLYKEQWIILLNIQQGGSTKFDHFKKILPPKDRFWADPFLIEQDDKRYLFIEELPFATDKGHLSVMEIDENGKVSPAVTILDKPYHLSYPFIFQMEDQYYMIPESYEDKSIQLYECTSFPFQWEHKMNLMSDISAFDTTLFFYNQKWWMFTIISEQRGSGHNDELFLFFADTPFTTDWTSHPKNPIISDVRLARPAGNIYEEYGKIIRPSQDCARKYGYGFNLNEIEILTETDYREKRILNVRPDWDHSLSRTHSFNHIPGCTVIDAVIQRPRFF